MDGTLEYALISLAAAVGLAVVTLLVVWLWAKLQALPPATPPLPPRRDRAQEEALLAVPTWRKHAWGAANGLVYERPLDIAAPAAALPDDAVLPPPREVEGRNGEV